MAEFENMRRIREHGRIAGEASTELMCVVGCSWSLYRAVLETGGNMVSRTKERVLDPLLVPALLALATPSIC